MSATESSEFAVPEVVGDEKEESKEIKATKRPAEVSVYPIISTFPNNYSPPPQTAIFRLYRGSRQTKIVFKQCSRTG